MQYHYSWRAGTHGAVRMAFDAGTQSKENTFKSRIKRRLKRKNASNVNAACIFITSCGITFI